ncbi:MAG: nitrilase-related carbon-nitrogen hydrolase [Anaerolineae bacterium]
MSRAKLALAQIEMKPAPLRERLDTHLAWADEARRQGAALIVFPELSLSGDGLTPAEVQAAALGEDDAAIHTLQQASQDIDLVAGFVERQEGPERPRYYNASAYFSRGEVRYWHRKLQPVGYPPFSEGDIFTPGERLACFSTPFGQTSLMICNDAWFAPWTFLAAQYGAGLFIYPAASREGALAQSLDIPATWSLINRYHAALYGAYVVFVNYAGERGGLRYWGGSQVVGPGGAVVAQAAGAGETLLLAEIDLDAVRRQRLAAPLVRDARPGLLARDARPGLLAREFGRWQGSRPPEA